MTETLAFTDLTETGWARLRVLRIEMVTLHPALFDAELDIEERRDSDDWRGFLRRVHPTIASRNGRDVALAGYVWPLDGDWGRAKIVSLYVRPDIRRQGVGAAIIDHMLDRIMAETGAREIMITSRPTNWEAVALIESLGFAPSDPERALTRDGSVAFTLSRRRDVARRG